MDDRESRIREVAHRLWEEEGHPHGRAAAHWEMASELVAIAENQKLATKPNPLRDDPDARGGKGEPVEPLIAVENQGEFPTMTDQGEEQTAPRRRAQRAAPEPVAKAPAPNAGKAERVAGKPAQKRKTKEE